MIDALGNQQDPARPWTPGPWRAVETIGEDWEVHSDPSCIVSCRGEDIRDGGYSADATVRLIALAPEMAEAILRLCERWSIPPVMEGGFMRNVADKLRAIQKGNT